MVAVRTLVLKGLIEGLILDALERAPTHGYGLMKDLEEIVGEAPNKNQVYPLLQRLEQEGLIRSGQAGTEPRTRQVYQITHEGAARLREYRAVPNPFKQRLITLFAIPVSGVPVDAPDLPPERSERSAPAAARAPAPMASEGWVPARVGDLPRGPPVRATFARVALNRHPGAGTWTLSVEHHEPLKYEGANECPLTYLYLAAQRLLFTPPEP